MARPSSSERTAVSESSARDQTQPEKQETRIEVLDGLRGLAFLMVFTVHVQLPAKLVAAFPRLEPIKETCWIGVPIFFVLSGYLITRLWLREVEATSRFSYPLFVARRAVRLWPLYFVASALALAGWSIPALREIGVATSPRWLLSLTTFTVNFACRSNWSAVEDSLGALVIFWTLAVEEQFYLSWGAILTWASRRGACLVCVLVLLISLAARWLLPVGGDFLRYRMNSAVAFGTLMVGCALALSSAVKPWSRIRSQVALILVLAVVPVLARLEWPLPVNTRSAFAVVTAVDLWCGAWVLVALCSTGPLIRLLTWNPLRTLGALSYAGYVLHFGVLRIYYQGVRPRLPSIAQPLLSVAVDLALIAVVLAVTIALARGWHALERPLRGLRARLHPRPAVPSS
jgi:peptidoglycan/LPS O-acetylase OafA/YrhL